MRVFIIAGSPQAERPVGLAPRPADRVIAADSGAAYGRAWGWPVHLLIGDLDSLPPTEADALQTAGVLVITAPAAKDETDLELALAYALADGAAQIVICAALGGRADHALANVLLLARPELAGLDVCIVEGRQTIYLLRGNLTPLPPLLAGEGGNGSPPSFAEPALSLSKGKGVGGLGAIFRTETGRPAHLALTGAAGDLLSLLPLGGDAAGVTTAGLAYPLRDETLYLGQARGISNVFEGVEAQVWLRDGMLLVIHTRLQTNE
jgi:thiamine pyrophosphokinase